MLREEDVDIKNEKILIIAGIFLQWLASFITDKKVFQGFIDEKFEYFFTKLLYFILLIVIWLFVYKVISGRKTERKIVIYSFPYFMVMLIVFFIFKYPEMHLLGDEANIYNAVLETGAIPGIFTYFTSLFYTLSLMLIPFEGGIVLIKMILQALMCGYCVWRFYKYFTLPVAYLIYALFLLPPFLLNGWFIHRMQMYMILYLFFVVILLFDFLEQKPVCTKKILLLQLISAVLALWRREGIYLIITTPIIISIVYQNGKKNKDWMKQIIFYLVILILIAIPELMTWSNRGTAISEASHTYNSYITHLCREGLEKQKYPQQMKDIDKVVSLEAVDRINEELGDKNYEDEFIAWKSVGNGVRENYTLSEYNQYVSAVWYIIIHEPALFLKTRLGAWNYAAIHSKGIFLPENSPLPFRIVAKICNSTYNLYIPIVVIILAFFYSMRKKIWLLFWLTGGLLAHTFLTALLMPASYFKYFYHTYAIGYLLLIIFICGKLSKHFEGKVEPAHGKG